MIDLDYQLGEDVSANDRSHVPAAKLVQTWLDAAHQHLVDNDLLSFKVKRPEVCVRIVDEAESQTLNHEYRDKNKPTNVLSFESDIPEFVRSNLVGDLVICASVVKQEANEQQKAVTHHWAHMCVHGYLHLQGFDHIDNSEAEVMEALEITILAHLGIDNPYQCD